MRYLNGKARHEKAQDGSDQWQITLPFQYRYLLDDEGHEIGWTKLIPDKGYRYRNDDGKIIKSETEVFLDGDGKRLAGGEPAVMLEVDTLYPADLTDLLDGLNDA